ncbi:hypothetical protein SAICODRAFT_73541 [Saitoella complicata NRRL Y-17804]|uniref:uncharacterized protein n=1 Tax=Saitoella complicata (strain BCRC 22490 / CBS 7301 / JCM 7358 / NBRC 10748 / NRRL Y-17804) TaxID=698492 RepID=UPI0008672704|nr:uncharacterized protein SAICODRAFT_73541 [Saitoella complicata NRRL Y-17804]ODQ50264.1 hypothetical protein SAICODRAFT_73541 [Saitoella complicata NRRL Y-17804]
MVPAAPLSPVKPSAAELKKLKGSSVSHMRRLSKLTGKDGVEGLFIPGVTQDAEGVTGLTNRVRLQKTKDSKSFLASRTWMDKQRQNVQAYEYLCHIGAAKEWMETAMNESIPPITDLEEALRDGVILARLARTFAPVLVTRIFEDPKRQYRHIDNIDRFFAFCRFVELPELFRFETTDLYDKRNIPKVIYCIHALSFVLYAKGMMTERVRNLVGELDFTEEEISKTQRGIDAAGVRLPDFGGLGKEFGEEPEPEPEPVETKEERIARELKNASCEIELLQGHARGALERKRWAGIMNALWENEDIIADFQGIARGFLIRKEVSPRLDMRRTVFDALVPLQAIARGKLARRQMQARDQHFASHEHLITRLQARAKANAARKSYLQHREQVHSKATVLSGLQAIARGRLARQKFTAQREELDTNREIVMLQALSRGHLLRQRLLSQIRELAMSLNSIIDLQAQCSAALVRDELRRKKEILAEEEPNIVNFQAAVRGHIARREFHTRQRFFRANMEKIVKIQSLVRAKQQGNAYKSLMVGKNPPVGTIKNFVHLLDDSNFDFEEEIEFERLRKLIVQRVRANEEAEQHIDQLDIKIALLVKNKITLDEVIRTQKRFTGHQSHLLHNNDPAGSDPFNLKALNKTSRTKLELYQTLFFLLQTRPEYLARLFARVRDLGMPEKDIKKVENLTMVLYGYGQKHREEYLLLKLVRQSIIEEVNRVESTQEFLRGNFLWLKLVVHYNRGAKYQKYMHDLLGPLVTKVVQDDFLNLESDPVMIYKNMINNEELRTGQRSSRPQVVDQAEAIRDPETRNAFIKHLSDLRDFTEMFIDAIENSVRTMPFGIRYIARETLRAVQAKFPDEAETILLKVVGNLIYYRYLNPAVVAPEHFGVIDGAITAQQRKNLGEIAKMLTQISQGRLFSSDNVYLQPLNEYVASAIGRMTSIYVSVTDVIDAETEFEFDEYEDLTATEKPMLYIKPSDICYTHSLVGRELDAIAPSTKDIFRDIIRDLGPLPSSSDMFMGETGDQEITLTLNSTIQPEGEADADFKALWLETKRSVLNIIRVQQGNSLMEILTKPTAEEDEWAWRNLLEHEMSSQQQRSAYSDTPVQDLSGLAYTDVKRMALENILRMEAAGKITRENGFQDLLNAIAIDIRTKHRRRQQRQRDIDSARQTLAHLDEKATYLAGQLESYNDYVEQSMLTLQTKKGKRRPIMPFTKQYFHMRDLQKSGRVPRFGSYKYSAQKLFEKGVLVEIKGYERGQWDKLYLTISCDDVGIFFVEASYHSIHIPGGSIQLRLDDLLQAQFQKQQHISLFDNLVKLNVNLTLHLIFKKFYV